MRRGLGAVRTKILAVDGGGPSAMPIAYADGAAAPVLLITGDADASVNPNNSARLAARIRARGGRADLVVYPGVGHERLVAALASPLARLAPVRRDVLDFVERLVQPRSPVPPQPCSRGGVGGRRPHERTDPTSAAG